MSVRLQEDIHLYPTVSGTKDHEWGHDHGKPNYCKSHSSTQISPNSELFPILPPPTPIHHWPVVIYTTCSASLIGPAVHHGTGPVNQPQPIPACVVHVCYLTTTRAPTGTVKKTTLICILSQNWIKYNNVQIVQSVIYSICIAVLMITNLMNWTPKGILHIHPLTTLEDIGVYC